MEPIHGEEADKSGCGADHTEATEREDETRREDLPHHEVTPKEEGAHEVPNELEKKKMKVR